MGFVPRRGDLAGPCRDQLWAATVVLRACRCQSTISNSTNANLQQLSDISHIFVLQRTLASLAADDHYKYLLPLLIPTTCWFAIANWVGWEYFRFA